MIKLLGCVLIICASAGIGLDMSNKLKSRKQILKTIVKMLDEIEIMLKSEYLTTNEIIDKIIEKDSFKNLDFFSQLSRLNINSSISENVSSSHVLCDEDKSKLSEFFEELGSTDMNGQLTRLSLCEAEFKASLVKAEENFQKYSKLYKAMGVLCGTFIAILLI